jgi:hypothetical protein
MLVKIINKSTNPLPKYETNGSAAMDVRADIENFDKYQLGMNFRYDEENKEIILFFFVEF